MTTHQSKLNQAAGLGLILVLSSLLQPKVGAEAELLSLKVVPAVCIAPCDLTVTLRIEPAADNEMVELVLEPRDDEAGCCSDTSYGRISELPMNEHSAKTFQIRYPSVPKGSYTLTATLWKHDGMSWIAAKSAASVLVK